MKKAIFICIILCCLMVPASAQDIIGIIKAGITKVIVAVDLKIQRLQNQTIWLQNAQKELENVLSKAKLAEIGDLVQKQKDLYMDYFDELSRVKSVIVYYHRVKDITDREAQMLANYTRAFALFKQDNHFTGEEILYMGEVYAGMIESSVRNVDQLALVIQALATSMTDAQRMKIIDLASAGIEQQYLDMEQFTTENQLLSLRRAKDEQEIQVVKSLYGL